VAFCGAEKLPDFAGNYLGFSCAPFVLHLICVERTDRKLSILYRQNEMQETLCYLFPIDRRLPKLNVAGSIPVSRSIGSTAPSLSILRFCLGARGCGADHQHGYGILVFMSTQPMR
jgi:hypothetical protein